MTFDDLKIKQVYSFTTYSAQFTGVALTRMRLVSIMDTSDARRSAEIDQLYNAIFPSLPQGTTRDIENRQWFKFKATNGNEVVLCDQWIVESSLELVVSCGYTVTIEDSAVGKENQIRAALAAIGMTNVSIVVNS